MTTTLLETPAPSAPAAYEGFENILVDGRWRQGRSGHIAEGRDPYSDEVLVRISQADERDLDEAFQTAAAQPDWWMEAEMSHVNDSPVNDTYNAPFGSEKNSGIGRYNGKWAIEEFTTGSASSTCRFSTRSEAEAETCPRTI